MSEIKAPMIYGKIADCMRQLGAIGKTSKNAQQGFMYRGVDAVMNALNPVLTANHVFCVPEVLEQHREERQTRNGGNLIYSILKMCYTLYAEDGSSVSATSLNACVGPCHSSSINNPSSIFTTGAGSPSKREYAFSVYEESSLSSGKNLPMTSAARLA